MKKSFYLLLFSLLLGFSACSDNDDDIKLPDITVNFTSTEIGIDEGNASAEIAVNLSRKASVGIDVTVTLTATDVVYGTDFTTSPAATDNVLKINIPAGSTSASFTVAKVANALFEGTETVKFDITSITVADGVKVGDKKQATLKFGAILSTGSLLTLEGKSATSNYANTVYVDFSSNTQLPVDRKSWSLGFYCGDQFRVFLNPAMQMAAAATTKSDIAAVTVADAEGLPRLVPSMMTAQFIDPKNVDNLQGDITKTAFAEVSATDADNKVYVVAMEGHTDTPANYYKVRVTRSGTGYKVEYGLLGGTEVTSIQVAKDNGYNMVGVSFDTKKTVNVEPKAKSWDIAWSYGTGSTLLNGNTVVYFMQDIVYTNNLAGAQVAEVLTSTVAYKDYVKANIASTTFTTARNTIGTTWRVTAKMNGSTDEVGVRSDRFYVVKDPNGNYYKLKFNKMGLANDGTERGRPEIEYALIR